VVYGRYRICNDGSDWRQCLLASADIGGRFESRGHGGGMAAIPKITTIGLLNLAWNIKVCFDHIYTKKGLVL